MALTVLFILLAVLLILGVPVAVSLALASLAYIILEGLPNVLLIHRMIGGIDSFPLLAIPFFILAGHLMNTGGITTKIFAFARALVGWLPGGLGHVNVGASVIFAGMSGAAVADAGGLGNIEIKAMREAGYETDFSVGVTAASSTIGPIIPPSLPLVIYGVIASVSIGELFIAGLIPGLLMALSLMIMVAWYAHRRGYPRDSRIDLCHIWATFKRAFLPLLTPVIIVGGIATGVFTPTESAVAAVVYALFLGAGRLSHAQLETPRARFNGYDRNFGGDFDDCRECIHFRVDSHRQSSREHSGRRLIGSHREQTYSTSADHDYHAVDRLVYGDHRRDNHSRPRSYANRFERRH